MEELQDYIVRVLDLSESGIITQQETWNKLIDLELINISNPIKTQKIKEDFLIAFLTIPSNYNDIYLKIINNRYFLMTQKEFNLSVKNTDEVPHELVLEPPKFVKTIINNIDKNDIIDEDNNTVLHYISKNNLTELLNTDLIDNFDYKLQNKDGKTPLELGDENTQKVLNHCIITSLENKIRFLEEDVKCISTRITNINNNVTFLKNLKYSKYSYYIISKYLITFFIGIVFCKFFF